MKNLIIILTFIFSITQLYPQSLDILGINASKYPNMTLDFRVKGSDNKEIRNFNQNDFIFSDSSCKNLKNFMVSCPPTGQNRLSIIFTVDRSPSMFLIVPGTGGQTKGQLVVKAFKAMLNVLDPQNYEAAVVAFAGNAYLMQDFTTNEDSMFIAVEEAYKTSRAQTNFNAGFLYDCNNSPGALKVAEHAKYKPVVLFLSDGEHNYNNTRCTPSQNLVWVAQIIAAANALPVPATILTFSFGAASIPPELVQISGATPFGQSYLTALSKTELENLFISLISELGTQGTPAPCQVFWEACCDGGNVSLTYNPFSITKQATYTVDNNLKPFLEVISNNPYFANINPGQNKDIIVNVTSRQNYVKFDATTPFTISDSRFQILNFPALKDNKLPKDSTLKLTVRYNSNDSGYHRADIVFNSSACNGNNWNATAGWLYSRNVHVGFGVLNQPHDTLFKGVFCNLSDKPVTINKIYPSQGDWSDFEIIEPVPPVVVQPGDCIEIKFRFTPSAEGLRKTTLVIETYDGTYYSDLTGDGSGYPNIQVAPANDILYPNANCKSYYHDTTITITNIGALALDINSVTLSNPTDFEQISWPAVPFTLQPTLSQGLVVRFNPKSMGNKTCVMTINSNSKYNPDYIVNLSGTRDSIGFTVSNSGVDFGQVCPDENVTRTVTITNTGTQQITVNAVDAGNFKVTPNTWTIPVGGTQDVTVSFSSNIENMYSENIIFTDDFCNFTNVVNVRAEVVIPKITYNPLVITSVVNGTNSGTMRITNNTTRSLTITSDNIPCSEMKILTPFPWIIPASGFKDVIVEYSPTGDNYLECFITLFGTECYFKDSIKVEGNPNLATATIQIEKYSGYAGFPITIPVNLRNLNKIVESGTTGFDTRIIYDQNLLTYQSISNGSVNLGAGFIDVSNMMLSGLNGDVLTNITFMVNISTPQSTVLDLTNTQPISGAIRITETDGEFTLNLTSSTIYIDQISAVTGETINIPIKVSNANNFNSVHKNIVTTLSYNYSLLEPVGSTPIGTIVNDKRVIELTMPFQADASGVLQNYQFRAMLGTSQNTVLDLSNTHVAEGQASFTETDGLFKLTNVCISSDPNNPNPRLFDPKGQAQILSISPNPADGETTITFEVQEEGIHTINIYSEIGELIVNVLNKNLKPAVYQVSINADIYSTGSYYIIYNTPTRIISQPMGILK